MSGLSTIQLSRFQLAAQFWEKYRNDENVDWELEDSYKPETIALALTEEYLRTKDITKIDFDRDEHKKCLLIALKIQELHFEFDDPNEARIGIEMKNIRANSYAHVSNDLKNSGQVAELIADGVSIYLKPEFKLALLISKWGIKNLIHAPELVTLKDLQTAYPEGIPLEQVGELLDKNLEEKAHNWVMQNLVSDLQKQKAVAAEIGKVFLPKEDYFTVGKKLATECSLIALTYYQLESLNEKYEEERKYLCNQFDQICKSLDLNISMEKFRYQGLDQIIAFFQNQSTLDSFGKQAKNIHEITIKICSETDLLTQRIETCREKKDFYERKAEKYKQLNKKIKNFYNKDLKQFNLQTKMLGRIKLGASCCSLFGKLLPTPLSTKVDAVSDGVKILADVGAEAVNSSRNTALRKLKKSLNNSQENAERLGFLSRQNLVELQALKQTKNDEVDVLISNRKFIEPKSYRTLLNDLEDWLKSDKSKQEEELNEQEKKLEDLSKNDQIPTKQEKKPKDQVKIESREKLNKQNKTSKNKVDKTETMKLSAQTTQELIQKAESSSANNSQKIEKKALEDEIQLAKRNIETTEELIKKVKKEKELADFESPLTNALGKLMEEEAAKLPDEKNQRWNEAFENLFNAKNSVQEKGYQQRQVVYNSFVPLADSLQFLTLECEWLRDSHLAPLIGNAPQFLSLAKDFDGIRNHVNTFKNFVETFQQSKQACELTDASEIIKTSTDALASGAEDLKKISSGLIVSGLVVPILGIIGLSAHFGSTLYRIARPAKNPVIEAMGKMFEKWNGYQADLLKEYVQILKDEMTEQDRHSTNNIIANIRVGNADVIKHLNSDRFNNFEFDINEIKNQIELKINFNEFTYQLSNYFLHSKDRLQNGYQLLENYEHTLCRVIQNPNFYSGFLMGGNGDRVNLHIFKALLEKTIDMRTKLTTSDNKEKLTLVSFLNLALKEIDYYLQQLTFPESQLEKAIKAQQNLINVINSRVKSTQKSRKAKKSNISDLLFQCKHENHPKLSDPLGWTKFSLFYQVHEKKYDLVQAITKPPFDWLPNWWDLYKRIDYHRIDTVTLHEAANKKSYKNQRIDTPFPASFILFSNLSSNFPKGYGLPKDYVDSDKISKELGVEQVPPPITRHINNKAAEKTKRITVKLFMSFSMHPFGLDNTYSLQTFDSSYVTVSDIQKISTSFPNISILSNYNSRIEKMISDFIKKVENPNMREDHILPSKTKTLVPLVFPKALLDFLVNKLESTTFSLESLKIGTLIPTSYDFCCRDEDKKFELIIQFYVQYNEDKRGEEHYCDFVIAEFDSDTVDSFRTCESHIRTEKKFFVSHERQDEYNAVVTEPYYNEFLIQAMLCGQYGLGLPGEGTYRLESGTLVAPVERAFPGLYSLFSSFPSTFKSYDSKENEKIPLREEKDFEINSNTSEYENHLSFDSQPFKINYNSNSFLHLHNEIVIKLGDLQNTDEYKNYLREYQLFQALYRLNYDCEEKVLKQAMETCSGLIEPKELQLIITEAMHLNASPFQIQRDEFNEECKNPNPSSIRLVLEKSKKELTEWRNELV